MSHHHDVWWPSGSSCSRISAQESCCCSVIKSCLTAIPWTAAHQAFLLLTSSQSLLKFTSIESVMLSNHLCCPFSFHLQSFPASWSFPMSLLFAVSGQSTGASVSTSVLPMNIQGSFPLGLTGLISFLSKGLSRVFSSTIIQKHQFFSAQPSLLSSSHINTWLVKKP